ncbi:hypothetical protein ElyMa_001992100 [Elysia marginata]|uniref:Uncharacterized protein n=1 Tax=Elysia marginata TaxID=1093978 RepID=A0AAV4F2P9_9GAST|nr:hypothetical protein ElyMa_001992100 [Elysia marginata]
MLLEECIISKKDKYVVERLFRKRKKEKLSLCETGLSNLVDAARAWRHGALLIQLQGKNKEALVEFLFQQWCQASSNLLKIRVVFIALGLLCHSISSDDQDITVKAIEDLEYNHEEADTRMLPHARHIAVSSDHIIIHSPDTDVLLISCAISKALMPSSMFTLAVV